MLNLLLFGPPGAGKGTQAIKISEKYGFNHISTGQVIRDEIEAGTPLGLSMRDYISRGELAPDELVIEMVTEYLEKHRDSAGSIFDGFPRTLVQAKEFDRILGRHGLAVDGMLSLEVPDELLIERLLLRGKQSGRPDDGSEQVIHNRLGIYNETTSVVGSFYDKCGKLFRIDGTGTIDETFDRLSGVIDNLLSKK